MKKETALAVAVLIAGLAVTGVVAIAWMFGMIFGL